MEHIHRRQQLQKHCIPVSLCTSTAPTSVGGLIGCSCAFLNGILKPATRMHATPASKFGGGERLHGSFAFVLPTEVPRASKRPGRGTIPTTPINKRQMMRTFVEAIYRYEIHLPYIYHNVLASVTAFWRLENVHWVFCSLWGVVVYVDVISGVVCGVRVSCAAEKRQMM